MVLKDVVDIISEQYMELVKMRKTLGTVLDTSELFSCGNFATFPFRRRTSSGLLFAQLLFPEYRAR